MSLLQKIEVNTDRTPLMIELPVDPKIAPYLVSTTKSFLWLEQPLRNNKLRVAIRNETLDQLYGEVVQNIYEMGVDSSWENSYSLSKDGVRKAIGYLQYYGIKDVEILCCETDPLSLGSSFESYSVTKVSWIKDCYIAVPKDRSYFGSMTDFGSDKYAILIHNPSRGISFSL